MSKPKTMERLIKVSFKKKKRLSKIDKAAIEILERIANSPEFLEGLERAYRDILVEGIYEPPTKN